MSIVDFSLYFSDDHPHDIPGDRYAAILAAARFADRARMHAVWLPERHFGSFGCGFPTPAVLAAAIAAQTERVRIHSGSVVLPPCDPIRVTREWSMVDTLSGGRVSLGVAGGPHREAMCESIEAIRAIRALWRGDPARPEPDFCTAILGTPDCYRHAGAAGLGVVTDLTTQSVDQLAENLVLYRDARAAHGHDPAAGRVVVLLPTFLGEDTAAARQTVRRLATAGVHEVACLVDFGLAPERVTEGLAAISELRSAFTGSGPAVQTADRGDLSTAERRIWSLEQTVPGHPAHNATLIVRLDGDLDVAALRAGMTTVVARHPALRTRFTEVDGEPRRVVEVSRPVALPVTDEPDTDAEAAAARIAEAETGRPFDLARGPLFDPRLVRLGERRHLLVLRGHRLAFDTGSAGIMSEEIAACYRAALTGGTPDLPEPTPRPPATAVPTDAPRYWTDLLADAPAELALPLDRPRPAQPTGRGAAIPVEFDAATTTAVHDLARRGRATPFMVVLAAFAVALRKLSGQGDIVVGAPFAHRPARTVGFFEHTLPLRMRVTDDISFADLVLAARDQVLGAHEHQEVPLPDVARALDVLARVDDDWPFAMDLPGVEAALTDAAVDRAVSDLALRLTTLGGTIRGKLHYAVDLFDATTAGRVVAALRAVLAAGTADPDRSVGDLVAVTAAEAGELLAWEDGGPRLHPPSALHSRVSNTGAVIDESGVVDRAELLARAAAVTAAVGTGPEPVGVLLPRGADAVAAQLGVARSGRAFVPLDPAQPPSRLAVILAESGVSAVVTRRALAAGLPAEVPLVLIDDLSAAEAGEVVDPDQDALAYVLFTSGSTGVPKGCAIEHRAISNMIDWYCAGLEITSRDRLCWFSAPGFDMSIAEVWPALRTGASLHVVPPDLRLDAAGLRDWLVVNRITVALMPTPMGELLLEQEWPTAALRHLVIGGDRLRRRPDASAPFAVWNIYGPTETAVVVTWTRVSPADDGPPAIGGPVPGVRLLVLDAAGRRVPAGAAGELHVAGTQVSRGYLSAEQTAARFVEHPEHGRMYRTGDIVRWRRDGELDFLHRNDAQVQIRGFRVEPGEVEHQLRALAGVRNAAVRVLEDGTLAAYVVTGEPIPALRATLATRLPDYMVPTSWMVLPALPLTASGKLDRAALPPITADLDAAEPATEVERRLHEIWCAELGLPSVGVTATFFQLGGHSLAAMRMVNRLRAEFGPVLGVLDFLRTPTIRGLAARLAPPPQVQVSDSASTGQLHGYRLTKASAAPNVLTLAMRFPLRGQVDQAALTEALTALVTRHPALRTRYRMRDGVLRQEVLAPRPVTLSVVSVDGPVPDETVEHWAGQPFDLDAEPAFRAVLFTGPECGELLLSMHHSLSDGWSMGIIITDLGALYRAASAGVDADLPDVPADYLDFTRWERDYLAERTTKDLVAAWAERVRDTGARPLLLPTTRPRGAHLSGLGASVTTALPPALVAKVAVTATALDTTPFAVLLAAFTALCHELTGAPVIAPQTSAANRPDTRFESTVGVFTHTSWLLVPVAEATSFADLVARTTTALWDRLATQAIPTAVLNSEAGGPFEGTPPRVLFGLYNNQHPPLSLPGLPPAHPVEVAFPVARAEQGWALSPTPDGGLNLYVEYSTDLFDEDTVTAWVTRYTTLLVAGLDSADTRTWTDRSLVVSRG